jgi:hypothetical protein
MQFYNFSTLHFEKFIFGFDTASSKTVNMFRQPNGEKKVVVFDMDETIGSFKELTSLLQYIKICQNKILTQHEFNKLLDLYPEFLRTGIVHVFKYLLKKKKKRECYKIYIYTNNVYSPEFPNYVRNYIDYKVHFMENKCFPAHCFGETTSSFRLKKRAKIIDQVIHAFKVENVIIEPLRTSKQKTFDDFIRCSQLPEETNICFIDNTYYNKMVRENIFYINVNAFVHHLTIDEIWERFNSPSLRSGEAVNVKEFKGVNSFLTPSHSNFPSQATENWSSPTLCSGEAMNLSEWNDENSQFLQKQIKRFFENTT